jgi:hypothetical protein
MANSLMLVVLSPLYSQWLTLHWLSICLRDVTLVHVIRQHRYKPDEPVGTISGACDIMPVLVVVSALSVALDIE